DICGRQNDILFVHCNVPAHLYGLYLLGTTLKGILFGLQVKRPHFMVKGFWQGYRKLFQLTGVRSPVDSDCFRVFRTLKQNGTVKMSQIKSYLNGRKIAT
ncbi:MAG: hypothetical protein F6K09_28355, partial [Merismopedia sp. SIO2A8]|nr:hypothetical protein [Merismopedia sp. SIO2A8]